MRSRRNNNSLWVGVEDFIRLNTWKRWLGHRNEVTGAGIISRKPAFERNQNIGTCWIRD